MRPLQRLIGIYRHTIAERHARNRDLAQLSAELAASGQRMDERIAAARDTPGHRDAVAHWVGIERWGQRRLRVALGEPFVADTHHPYRPEREADLATLRRDFAATRADTLTLIERLRAAGVDPRRTVAHNDLGDLSVRAWLAYLLQHPEQEARARMRG